MGGIRAAGPDDEPALWRMLAYAAWVGPDEDVRRLGRLTRYVSGWGHREGDLGVLAEAGGGDVVGAAWLRLLVGPEQSAEVFVEPDTPELVVAVVPGQRCSGLGTRLLGELLHRAEEAGRYRGVVLSARAENPAVRLYERLGFVRTGVIGNRVGGTSHRMVLAFPAEPRGA
jgi:ribosomal protein S18 acetylase RimI-like enzyme